MTTQNPVQPLTVQQLAEIEARAQAATEGPWVATKDGTDANVPLVFVNRTTPKAVTYSSVLWNADWATEADAEFTAHARTDVPALLGEVSRLRAERDAFRDQRNRVFETNEHLIAKVEESSQARLRAENEARAALRSSADKGAQR